MKESSLAKAIDKAAQQRAHAIITKMREAITTALQPYWRPKNAGDEDIGDDILELLRKLAESREWRAVSFMPSQHMLEACRAAIINDLLSGLPKLRELAEMAGDDEGEANE